MAETMIHTLGDSTLDNLFWMLADGNDLKTAKEKSVEGKLGKMGHKVVSHAYDGFTTKNVLYGGLIGSVLPRVQGFNAYMKEQNATLFNEPSNVIVRPLSDLRDSISKAPNATHFVVISVGGNDFRENLLNPIALIANIGAIQKRHLEIVEKVKNLGGKDIRPILMFQYRTDAKNDPYRIYTVFKLLGIVAITTQVASLAFLTAPLWLLAGKISLLTCGILTGLGGVGLFGTTRFFPFGITKDVLKGKKIATAVLNRMMETFYQPALKYAKAKNIPILDLPNTFDPYSNLYDCGIEPNEKGGELIAKGIDHIVRNHNFAGLSKLYAKPSNANNYVEKVNTPASWQVV